MKSLVIVGSGPIEHDLSKIIDSFEYVVRFNDCKNYNVNSGKKTDILILNNSQVTNNATNFFLNFRDEIPYLTLAKQVWFAKPKPFFLNKYFTKLLNIHKRKSVLYKIFNKKEYKRKKRILKSEIEATLQKINIGDEIISAQNIPKDKVKQITDKLYLSLCNKLNLFKDNTFASMPSTGIVGVEMILNDQFFNDYEKYIIGFSWEGWNGHPWKEEKALVQYYIDNGSLKLLT